MSQFNAYFSTLTITYLLEAYALRKMNVVSEDELILNITSMVSVMGTKDNIAIPAQNKQLYAEMLNKNSGTMMIVLDELVNATYIIRNKNDNVGNNYMVNFDHDYIKKFIDFHGIALKYVSHPSYSLKRKLDDFLQSSSPFQGVKKIEQNEENSLCTAIEKMKLSSTPLNSKTNSVNSAPERKKKKSSEEEEKDDDCNVEENADLVAKLDKAFSQVEESKDDVEKEVYYVKSESNPKVKYAVTATSCSCPAFTYGKGKPCKHMTTSNPNHFVKKNKVIATNQKEDEKTDTSLLIKAVYSVQRDSDLDKFYNIYLHVNDKYTCTCPSYKYQSSKNNSYCKHINGFLNNHYQKYDKFTLVNHFKKNDNIPIVITTHIDIYIKYFTQKMFNDDIDRLYFVPETKYYGLYVWAFDDSLTDNKKEKENSQHVIKENKLYQEENNYESDDDYESVGPDGTYDGFTDDD